MSDEGRLVANRYRIIERIGTGAMGAVWKAQDEVLHRDVAIKQLLLQPGLEENEAEDARQRTMREARLAARLHHPNAISVFDVVTDEHGQPCLIMEYLPSTSLAAVLQEQRTLDPLEVARIGAQISSALTDAHQVGVVHRDIKPGNVLLAENGTVKLTDFGISRATDDVTVTKTGMIAGTPAYLAPEVAVGGDPGPESDVFALGSTLYAATEGQPPFGLSENTLSLLHAVAAGQINPPRQSGPLASVLAVMLHPETQHRPTADESEDLLAAVARGETPLGGPTDETVMAASIGAAGAAAGAGAAAAASTEAGPVGYLDEQDDLQNFDGHYSGTLSGDVGAGLGTTVDEGPFQPGDGYPVEDYDATRAVPTGVIGHGDYGGYGDYGSYYPGTYEGYEYADDDYYDYPPEDDHNGVPPAVPMEDEDDDERGNWKIPAAIGAVTLLGLVALAIWIFSPPSGEGEADQPPVPAPSDTTTTSSSRETTTTNTTTTTTTTTTSEPAPNPNPGGDVDQPPPAQNDDPPPQQTTTPDDPEPTDTESSTTTTTATTTTSTDEPTTTPTQPEEPTVPAAN